MSDSGPDAYTGILDRTLEHGREPGSSVLRLVWTFCCSAPYLPIALSAKSLRGCLL